MQLQPESVRKQSNRAQEPKSSHGTNLINVRIAFGTGLKEFNAKLVGKRLTLAEWDLALALHHIALITHQNLYRTHYATNSLLGKHKQGTLHSTVHQSMPCSRCS